MRKLSNSKRRVGSIFMRPSARYPHVDGLIFNSGLFSYSNNGVGDVFGLYNHLASAVSGLRKSVCPSHISTLVTLRCINPIKGMIWRWLGSDIGEERFKAITPLFAHLYSAPSVMFECYVFRIITPSLCASPRSVFRHTLFNLSLHFTRRHQASKLVNTYVR